MAKARTRRPADPTDAEALAAWLGEQRWFAGQPGRFTVTGVERTTVPGPTIAGQPVDDVADHLVVSLVAVEDDTGRSVAEQSGRDHVGRTRVLPLHS